MRKRVAGRLRFSDRRWQNAYERLKRDTFRTVPFYRERWALVSTDPVPADQLQRRRHDLVPLRGGDVAVDAWRGFGFLAAMVQTWRAGWVLAVITDRPPPRKIPGLPRRVRVACVAPSTLDPSPFDTRFTSAADLQALAAAGTPVAVLGPQDELAHLAGAGLVRLPVYSPEAGVPARAQPGAMLRDGLLGYLAVYVECDQWHLDWRHVHAANTGGGVAFTLLRQGSPRLVDVLAGTGLRLARCPRHNSPVLVPDPRWRAPGT